MWGRRCNQGTISGSKDSSIKNKAGAHPGFRPGRCPIFMSRSITDKPKKKRGRPYQGGRDPMSGVRMPLEEKRAIEAWGRKQSPSLTFSGALRHRWMTSLIFRVFMVARQ